MKKIPTLFERDWTGDRSRVTPTVHPGCEWVTNGEGVATRKLDGTCCYILHGKLWKRRELKNGEGIPAEFVTVDYDEETKKTVGWIPVTDDPSDKFHREGLANAKAELSDGTYELVGPKVQGNPEGYTVHTLVSHSDKELVFKEPVPRDFEGLKSFLTGRDIEGIVFHHPDGRVAKIKLRDFGIKRNAAARGRPIP